MTEITVVGAGGEYMESVVIVEWHKKVGDMISVGDLVVTVETAKAATEIEATDSGILSEIRAEVGDEVPVGAVLGIIGGDVKSPAAPAAPAQTATPAAVATPASAPAATAIAGNSDRIVASPLARRVAAQRNIDLATVKASSQSGRIRMRDLETAPAPSAVVQQPQPVAQPVFQAAASAPARQVSTSLNITLRGPDNAEKIVLLHGFGSDGPSWQPLLSAIGGGYQFVLVDLPSHGRSPLHPTGLSVHDLSAAVEGALSAAGIEDFHLVGHSLGGAVSLALAARGRFSIRSLTLLAPAGLGPEIDGGFTQGFATATRAESLTPWLQKLVANPALISSAFVSATMAARSDAALREAQSALGHTLFPDGTQATNLRDVVRDLLIPQKIVWGEQDRIIPMRHGLSTGGAAGVHVLPEVGHLPHVEAPALVARLVLQNIRSAAH
jgi:pimeloyl-ACP methyl ester carboxylesterase